MSDTWKVPRTPEQLKEERNNSIANAFMGSLTRMTDRFTCDSCPRAPICTLAFDLYNTNGDCLYDK